MAVRVRKSVYSLADEAPELVWYRRAVAKLKTLPRNQPGSWEFLGACHGIVASVVPPPAAAGLWNECQHQTWFFLPWHRGYLAGFEAIIAATVEELGGPKDWALPYWNYSDTSDPRARQLPPAFRNRVMPDGSANDLWSPRNAPVPPQTVLTLSSGDVTLGALNAANFTNPAGSVTTGFGGPQTAWNHNGGPNGELESRPHNVVHNGVGGLMRDPRTAALDPIFWLHHCNIDRLWEVWRGKVTPPRDPGAAQWLNGVPFKLITKGGATFNFVSQQSLDTQTLLHGYKYDSVTPVVPPVVVAGVAPPSGTVGSRVAAMSPQLPSELVAGNEESVRLGAERAETVVRLPKQRVDSLRSLATTATPRRFYLSLEGVVASGPARDYKVFLDLPDDDRVPLQVGILTTFGIAVASDKTGPHGGSGLSQVFDVTDAIEELGAASQLANLRVTFEPVPRGPVEEVPDNHAYADLLRAEPSDLVVGRVNLYSE